MVATSNADAGITAFPLDWENINYMPVPSNYGQTVLVPWANGSVRGFSSDIWYDYAGADGWELVYNVFTTTQSLPNNPWFCLYNKYRGLLRIYVYTTTTGFTNSTYLTSGLNLAPNSVTTPLLNYIGQDVVDVTINPSKITQIEPTQMATGVWYCSQYEMAYDDQTLNNTLQQLGLNWTLGWSEITSVTLGGSSTGSLKGTIGTQKTTGYDFLGNITKGALNLVGSLILKNNKGSNTSDPGQNNLLGIPSFLFNQLYTGLTASTTNSIAVNIFNAILRGGTTTTGSVQDVNLTLNVNTQLTGSNSSPGALIPSPGLGLGIPGLSNSQSAAGYIPLYNKPMGVFYISNTRPQVKIVSEEHTPPSNFDGDSYYYTTFELQTSSYTVKINPELSSIASVTNTEVLLPESTVDPHNHFYSFSATPISIGGVNYYRAYLMDGTMIYPSLAGALVRITVTVSPAGRSSFDIIKTFLADTIN